MLGLESKTICLHLMQMIPIAALILFTVPSASHAEPLLLLRTEIDGFKAPVNVSQAIKRPVDIFLNKNGDLVVRRRGVSITMAYNPPNEIIEPQERIRVAQQQDCPSISGISVKISLLF